jgi:hypothetical protein
MKSQQVQPGDRYAVGGEEHNWAIRAIRGQ